MNRSLRLACWLRMPQLSFYSHDSDLQSMERASKATDSTMDEERASLCKTLLRQTQEWCDPMADLQDQGTRYATQNKNLNKSSDRADKVWARVFWASLPLYSSRRRLGWRRTDVGAINLFTLIQSTNKLQGTKSHSKTMIMCCPAWSTRGCLHLTMLNLHHQKRSKSKTFDSKLSHPLGESNHASASPPPSQASRSEKYPTILTEAAFMGSTRQFVVALRDAPLPRGLVQCSKGQRVGRD